MRVRTEAKRESILDTASDVFMELGFERTTMSEIALRMGGSKATLYGYFQSKEALFFAVVERQIAEQLEPMFQALPSQAGEDPLSVLTGLGEQLMISVTTPEAIALRRMVIAESGQTDIGQRFWQSGPQKGLQSLEYYLEAATQAGRLAVSDPAVAAQHLHALIKAEPEEPLLLGVQTGWTPEEIKGAVDRAVKVFLAAYGPRVSS